MVPSNRRRRRPRGTTDPNIVATWSPRQKAIEDMHSNLELPLAEAGLPVRIVNTMENNGVFLVKDLLEESTETLVSMANIGAKTIREISDCIRKLGLEPPWKYTPKKPAYTKNHKRKPK